MSSPSTSPRSDNPLLALDEHSELPTLEDALNCYNYEWTHQGTSVTSTLLGNNNPFGSEDINRHYQKFQIKSVSRVHGVIWLGLFALFSYGFLLSFFHFDVDLTPMRVILSLRMAISLLALYNYYEIFHARVSHLEEKTVFYRYVRYVTGLSDFIIVSFTLVNCAAYVWESSRGSCLLIKDNEASADSHNAFFLHCNPSYEIGGTPMNSMILLLVGNIFVVTTLRCHSSWSARVSYFATCISTVVAALVSPDFKQSYLVMLSSIFAIVIYEDIENNSLVMFKALLDLETTKRIQMKELKIFIGNVAHDLKTPLHGLTMCMDHLLMDCREAFKERERGGGSCDAIRSRHGYKDGILQTMELCKANCSFMSAAISRTVDFTKSASNIALNATMETVSITNAMQWAQTCLSNVQTRIPIKVMPLPPGVCEYVVTDKHWLMENILCYLSNATKYSASGTITISASLIDDSTDSCTGSRSDEVGAKKEVFSIGAPMVSMSFGAGDDSKALCSDDASDDINGKHRLQMLCFAVEDEGIGVEDSKKASLFKPFRQTMRLAGGTGLGLYSLSKRVEVLRGKYGVGNRLDGRPGSRFWFTIPYVPDEDYKTNVNQESDEYSSIMNQENDPADNSLKIEGCVTTSFQEQDHVEASSNFSSQNDKKLIATALVVEDSAVISKATARMLTKAGYTVDVAENGAIGLEKMKQCVYSVVIMDLQMPIMDGLEATKRIRAFEKESEVESKQFIIAASANGAEDVRQGALESGANSFVSKPFSVEALSGIYRPNEAI